MLSPVQLFDMYTPAITKGFVCQRREEKKLCFPDTPTCACACGSVVSRGLCVAVKYFNPLTHTVFSPFVRIWGWVDVCCPLHLASFLFFTVSQPYINATNVKLFGPDYTRSITAVCHSSLRPLHKGKKKSAAWKLAKVHLRRIMLHKSRCLHCRGEWLWLTVSFLFETIIKYKHH